MVDRTILTGASVRLEPLASCHVKGLAEAARRGVYPFTPVPWGQAETRAYVAQARAEREAGTSLAFAVIDRQDERIVGSTRFRHLDQRAAEPGAIHSAVEIGHSWLSGTTRETDINLEANLLMLRHAFEAWGVRQVSFRVDTRNHRSRAALEKLGATCEGVGRMPSPGLDGALRHVARYSVWAEEWPAVREIIGLRLSLHAPSLVLRPNPA
ncbi:GNAT family protein [Streptomyces microflavus]|uniref:GNAT family N-acetyltransferase n=1 Tax=Streptomyces microflavus TaxID=1919 RepID=UPI0033B4D4D3